MYEDIQRSLLKDLKTIAGNLGLVVSRRDWDSLYREVVGNPLAATQLYRALNASLCKEEAPSFTFPSGKRVVFGSRDAHLVHAFRQALGMFSRVHALVSKEQETRQLREAMQRVTAAPVMELPEHILTDMREFVCAVIGWRPPSVDTMRMKHGPGAVAESKKRNKIRSRYVPKGIADYIDRQAYWYDLPNKGPDGVVTHKIVAPDFTRCFTLPHQPSDGFRRARMATRVVTVPKDAMKVRIISCEPALGQFAQQGVMDVLYKRMMRFKQLNPMDQSRNRQLALRGSVSADIDTLDCSNASDCVRLKHVTAIFPAEWMDILVAFRSPAMEFPEGRVEISTFAPMGSALCFPVEMLVFGAAVYAAYAQAGLACTVHDFFKRDDWGIFGDDIICHHDATVLVFMILSKMGITLNESKCCTGLALFRESCGLDCFNGSDVSIVRPRELSDRRIAAAPMVQHANVLFAAGFCATAQTLANHVRVPVSIGYGPHLAEPGLHWPRYGQLRYNQALQRLECQVPHNRAKNLPAEQGWEALFTWFTNQRLSSSPFEQVEQVPTVMWVPADPRFACDQLAFLRQSVRMSKGCAPYAKGTPVGGDPNVPYKKPVRTDLPSVTELESWRSKRDELSRLWQ